MPSVALPRVLKRLIRSIRRKSDDVKDKAKKDAGHHIEAITITASVTSDPLQAIALANRQANAEHSLVHQLPVELTLHILHLAVPPSSSTFYQSLFAFAGVCHHWRDIIHSTPQFWVTVTSKVNEQLTKLAYEKAGRLLLHVFGEAPTIFNALPVVFEETSRWETAILTVTAAIPDPSIPHPQYIAPAPSLQRLHLTGALTPLPHPYPQTMVVMPYLGNLFANDLRTLVELKLYAVATNWEPKSFRDLKRLDLQAIPAEPPTSTQILNIIRQCPGLAELLLMDIAIHDHDVPLVPDEPAVVASSITRLVLNLMCPGTLRVLMSGIDTPALESFMFRCRELDDSRLLSRCATTKAFAVLKRAFATKKRIRITVTGTSIEVSCDDDSDPVLCVQLNPIHLMEYFATDFVRADDMPGSSGWTIRDFKSQPHVFPVQCFIKTPNTVFIALERVDNLLDIIDWLSRPSYQDHKLRWPLPRLRKILIMNQTCDVWSVARLLDRRHNASKKNPKGWPSPLEVVFDGVKKPVLSSSVEEILERVGREKLVWTNEPLEELEAEKLIEALD